jgi:hypothetical protein
LQKRVGGKAKKAGMVSEEDETPDDVRKSEK